MEIVKGKIEHVNQISQLLFDHFTRLNNRFGYPKYKTNIDRFREIVHERLSDNDSIYKYIVLEDNGNFAGFINLLFTKDISEILLLELRDGYNEYNNATLLLNSALKEFKNAGVKKIITQISPEEPHFKKIFEEIGGNVLLWTAIYEIK